MPSRPKRYQTEGHFHFITLSCYRRLPYLNNNAARIATETLIETLRQRHGLG
jgi:putative transposase